MMQETTLSKIREKLGELGFSVADVEKGVADAIKGSKKADAIYFHKRGYRDTVIQMQEVSGVQRWFMQEGEKGGFEDI
jgi:predicted transcriptional regulator